MLETNHSQIKTLFCYYTARDILFHETQSKRNPHVNRMNHVTRS